MITQRTRRMLPVSITRRRRLCSFNGFSGLERQEGFTPRESNDEPGSKLGALGVLEPVMGDAKRNAR